MKITLDITDALLARAERHAEETGRPLSAVVEEGLRRVLVSPSARAPYKLADLSVGDPSAPDPLAGLSWPQLRAKIYGDPEPD